MYRKVGAQVHWNIKNDCSSARTWDFFSFLHWCIVCTEKYVHYKHIILQLKLSETMYTVAFQRFVYQLKSLYFMSSLSIN